MKSFRYASYTDFCLYQPLQPHLYPAIQYLQKYNTIPTIIQYNTYNNTLPSIKHYLQSMHGIYEDLKSKVIPKTTSKHQPIKKYKTMGIVEDILKLM